MPLRNASKRVRRFAFKSLFRLSAWIVMTYLVIAILTLGTVRFDTIALYGVVLATFGVIAYLFGWFLWFAGPVLLVVAGIEYRHDIKHSRLQQNAS